MNDDTQNDCPDDISTTLIVEHVLVRDRESGAVLLSRRGIASEKPKISEIDWNERQDDPAH